MAWKRFICGFDPHGDKQDRKANEKFFKFVELWKPDIRVCGGDLWDFRPLRKRANEEERRERMQEDFEAGVEWLTRLQATHFLRGNHDERLWDLAQSDTGILSHYALKGIGEVDDLLKSLKCKMLPYDKRHGILQLGHLKIIHGYAAGITAARRSAQTYGSVLMGHGHGIQHVSIEGIENRVGRMCGCLCSLDMEYTRAAMGSLIWRHGFVYGVVNDRTGSYHVWQAEQVHGQWLLPSDIVEI